jgi:hypothetical protein
MDDISLSISFIYIRIANFRQLLNRLEALNHEEIGK